jgi:hypothetical protein
MTPTAEGNGYWLVASDGGMFSFGGAIYHGSIPGLGIHPAGSGLPHSLAKPIVGMSASPNGEGYLMVASDCGVFAFGNAPLEGSCPALPKHTCGAPVVSVLSDASGGGYWVVTSVGTVYRLWERRIPRRVEQCGLSGCRCSGDPRR